LQDTVIALQALSEYSIKSFSAILDMTCHVRSEVDDQFQKTFSLTREDALVLKSVPQVGMMMMMMMMMMMLMMTMMMMMMMTTTMMMMMMMMMMMVVVVVVVEVEMEEEEDASNYTKTD
jgi:hypothetical protein